MESATIDRWAPAVVVFAGLAALTVLLLGAFAKEPDPFTAGDAAGQLMGIEPEPPQSLLADHQWAMVLAAVVLGVCLLYGLYLLIAAAVARGVRSGSDPT